MDIFAEYDEFKKLPVHIGVAYKFFSHFQVDSMGHIWFAGADHPSQKEGEADAIKKFLKETRKEIRSGTVSKGECSCRMWFWIAKILDMELWTSEVRQEIMRWGDLCETILI